MYLPFTDVSTIANSVEGFVSLNSNTKRLSSFDGGSWVNYSTIENDSFVVIPTSPSDSGFKGEFRYDSASKYLYTCIETDTWVRHLVETSW